MDVTRSPSPEWHRIMEDASPGNVFQTPAWADYRTMTASIAPVYFVAGRLNAENSLTGAALGFEVPLLGSRLRPFAWRLAFDSAPMPAQARAEFTEALVAWARRRPGLVSMELGSLDGDWQTDRLKTRQRRLEFVVDVTAGHDLQGRMRKSTRYEVRRATRERVTVSLARDEKDVDAFVGMHAATLEDLALRKNVSGARVPPDTMAAAVRGLIASRNADLFIARLDSSPIGACLFGYAGRTAYYLLNGSSPAARRHAATHVTIATALEEFRARRFEAVNLGGVPAESTAEDHPDHGLYGFKRGFGGDVVTRTGGTVVLRPRRAAAIARARRALKGADSG
jgi:hypothetical protein